MMMMKIKFVFAWYDLWIGAYWDRKSRHLYIMVPVVGIRLEFPKPIVRQCPFVYWGCQFPDIIDCKKCIVLSPKIETVDK